MEALFIKLINMSINASYLIIAVIIIRYFFKKAPKNMICLLWGLVAIRLLIPFSFESTTSLLPTATTIQEDILYQDSTHINNGLSTDNNNIIDSETPQSLNPNQAENTNPIQVILFASSIIWIIGIIVLMLYSFFSIIQIKRKVATAVPMQDNIYQCDIIGSPFVFGLFRPRIYLPFSIEASSLNYVLAHEKAHIKRRDHWFKAIGFLLLTVHWFNPLVWVAYMLLCRDIELACDEKVLMQIGSQEKKSYSTTLLACTLKRSSIALCPLAFGEIGVKHRVKNILNFRKPTLWIMIVSIILCIIIMLTFSSNPLGKGIHIDRVRLDVYDYPITEECITKLNSGYFSKDKDLYSQLLEEKYDKNTSYGNLICAVYNISIPYSAFYNLDDCNFSYTLKVDDNYKNNFFMSRGFLSDAEDGKSTRDYVIAVYGMSKDKTNDELIKIIKKAKIDFTLHNQYNDHKISKNVSSRFEDVKTDHVTKLDISNSGGTIFDN